MTAVSYYAFLSLVAINEFSEMPYSESIEASSCIDSSGVLVIYLFFLIIYISCYKINSFSMRLLKYNSWFIKL